MSRRRIRLTPMRRHLAAILTIALSTAFVAVMMLGGELLQQSFNASSAAALRGADVVATQQDGAPRTSAPEIPQASDAWPNITTYADIRAGHERAFAEATMLPPARAVETPLVSGRSAARAGEIVIEQRLADALGIAPGARIEIEGRAPGEPATPLTVVGVTANTDTGLLSVGPGRLFLTPHSARQVLGADPAELTDTWYYALPDSADADAVASSADGKDGLKVRSAQAVMEQSEQENSGGFVSLGVIVGAFVLVALATAGVVVANTFSVTIAQRVRDLALLRTLGATSGQVARTVMRESATVAVIGSLAGIVLGHGLVQAALALSFALGWVPMLTAVPFSLAAILVPLLAGTVITLLASLAPLRRATGVAPIAALRPAAVDVGSRRRLGLGGVLALAAIILGIALMAGGVLIAHDPSRSELAGLAVLAATAGGALSLIGLLLAMRALVGPLTGLVGALLAPLGGVPARLAAANARRNPGRSAATVAALVIGTTLMASMAVGARTAEVSLTEDLANRKPIDVIITAESMPKDAADQVERIDGIGRAELVQRGEVAVGADDTLTVTGITAEQMRGVSARPSLGDEVRPGVILTGETRAKRFGLHDGQRLTVPTAAGGTAKVTVQVVGNLDLTVTDPGTLRGIVGDRAQPAVFARFAPGTSSGEAIEAVTALQQRLPQSGFVGADVSGEGVERGMYGQILQVMLGITIGLLAVAVIVAIVGVANTLSLGVIERTGENALLRALGTTRSQMRSMLGWEGVLLGLIGAAIGVVAGSVYGVIGVSTVLGTAFPLVVSVPWLQLGVLLVASVAAGFLASVLPARRAARTAPAQALAA